MATAAKESQQPLKLGQILQKQQEPFILEEFLSERGKEVKKSLNLSKRNRIPHYRKVLGAACKKLVSKNKIFYGKDENFRNFQEQEVDAEEQYTIAENSQFLKLFDERENQIETNGNFQCKKSMEEESKQHSPVSVLEKSLNYETEDSMSSNSASSCLESRELEELACVHPERIQYSLSRKVLHQTRQLLFDCVRELVETHEKNGKRRSGSDPTATEELRQLISEKIKGWGKQSGDISNITQLLDSDFIHSKIEWSDFQSERRDVGVDVADAIMGEIVREIVIDLKSM